MRLRRTSRILSAAALATLGIAAPSGAATVTVTGTITGSTLALSTSANPSFAANLDNGDSNPSYALPLGVQDTRGTGQGWNTTITSTQFTTGGATPATLPTGASSLTGLAASGGTGTNTMPGNAVGYPVAIPAGTTAPPPTKFFDAAANTGAGRFNLTPTVSVFVPQDTLAGSYASTLTIAIVTGP